MKTVKTELAEKYIKISELITQLQNITFYSGSPDSGEYGMARQLREDLENQREQLLKNHYTKN